VPTWRVDEVAIDGEIQRHVHLLALSGFRPISDGPDEPQPT
jgi:hypothetical protein